MRKVTASARDRGLGTIFAEQERDDYSSFPSRGKEGDELFPWDLISLSPSCRKTGIVVPLLFYSSRPLEPGLERWRGRGGECNEVETIKRERGAPDGAEHVRLSLPLLAGHAVINLSKTQQYNRAMKKAPRTR